MRYCTDSNGNPKGAPRRVRGPRGGADNTRAAAERKSEPLSQLALTVSRIHTHTCHHVTRSCSYIFVGPGAPNGLARRSCFSVMFAPLHPIQRPSSAVSQRAGPAPAPPRSVTPGAVFERDGGLVRRNSLSWDRDAAGLPPPPSEIDHYGDISNALISSHAAHTRNARHSSDQLSGMNAGLDHDVRADRAQSHMNTVHKHPKVRLELVLNKDTFQAGGSISGRLELSSATSQRLRLGEVAVELEGIEGA